MWKDDPVAAAHDFRHVIPPAEKPDDIAEAHFRATLTNNLLERSGAHKDPHRCGVKPAHLGQNINGKHGILLGYHPAGEEENPRVFGETQIASEPQSISYSYFESSGINAEILPNVHPCPPIPPTNKGVQTVVGVPDNAVCHHEACSTQNRSHD